MWKVFKVRNLEIFASNIKIAAAKLIQIDAHLHLINFSKKMFSRVNHWTGTVTDLS